MRNRPQRRSRAVGAGFLGWLTSRWKMLPANFRWNIEDTFQPEDIAERLLPGEEPQLELRLAWYRDITGGIVFGYFRIVFLVTLVLTAALFILSLQLGLTLLLAAAPIVFLAAIVVVAIRQRVEYLQWRLLKTNARVIISIPQPGSWPLVDNIELKGLPTVVDTNWSRNPFWRLFQFLTGARDVYLSLAAFRFVEGTARVGDALIIPDIMPGDVFALKQAVFTVPVRIPMPVVFPTPQQVRIVDDETS